MTLEELAGLGRITKEVEPFKGLKVKLHSLTVKEEEEIYAELAKVPDDMLVKTSLLQVETLVRSIETINGEKFHQPTILRDYLKGLQRHTFGLIWQSWVKEIEEPSVLSVDDLKKNSEPQKAA